jgi:hypothetical protein
LGSLFLLSGCFETKFDFKTIVDSDGSVTRETRIEGPGADLFKEPSGPGWQTQSWQGPGKGRFIAREEKHVVALGKFGPGEVTFSDYDFNVAKQEANWEPQDKKELEEAGINPPYDQSLYSRNNVEVKISRGWLTETMTYREIFENEGIIELLLMDVKKGIQKDGAQNGRQFTEAELQQLAKLRLEDEFLPNFQFHSEVSLPGRITSSNAKTVKGGKAIWDFTMKDFEEDYSFYRLEATSRSLRLPFFLILIGVGLAGVSLFILATLGIQMSRQKPSPPPRSKKKSS